MPRYLTVLSSFVWALMRFLLPAGRPDGFPERPGANHPRLCGACSSPVLAGALSSATFRVMHCSEGRTKARESVAPSLEEKATPHFYEGITRTDEAVASARGS